MGQHAEKDRMGINESRWGLRMRHLSRQEGLGRGEKRLTGHKKGNRTKFSIRWDRQFERTAEGRTHGDRGNFTSTEGLTND